MKKATTKLNSCGHAGAPRRGLCPNCYKKWLKAHNPAYLANQRISIQKHYRRNPSVYKAKARAREQLINNRVPKWVDKEHLAKIRQFYKECPPGHHVDHIVPLNGRNVCGLHVLNNLQYLTAEQNKAKSNKY